MEMSPETSLRLFEEGATLIFLNVPTATEIGIDMQSWSAGDKFKGIKMIPPGLHFVYFSAVNKEGNVAPRTGFFHFFQKTEVLVKKYDPRAEDISTAEVPAEEVERFKMNLKEMDKFLGPYPYDLWRKWVSLTNRINPEVMEARNPTSGVILSAPSLVLDEDQSAPPPDSKRTKLQEAEALLPKMTEDPDSKIKWTDIPSRNYPEGATPAEISRHFLDHSYKLDQLLSNYKKPEDLLSEVQFAFVTFLVGQNYSSFEQWKSLVKIISFSEAAIVKYPKLYSDFLSDLYFQISNVDPEIFSDIVLNNNFMYSCVRQLQRNISDCNSVQSTLRLKIERFCKFLEGKFRWIFDMEEEEEDDQPVVVDLSESISDQPVVVGSSDNNLVTIQEMSEDIE